MQQYANWGFAPNPTYFFVLIQKSMQKKSRLRPLRSKNYDGWLKNLNLHLLLVGASNSRFFFTPPALVFRLIGRCQQVKETGTGAAGEFTP